MSAIQGKGSDTVASLMGGSAGPALEYLIDAAQRSVLFCDVMRTRGNEYREHLAKVAPHVLDYAVEVIADGRQFERPVNYALVRIIPPKAIEIDPLKRPFVIVDPRAGHGPGIGGFKADSEIGVALKAGHPCYFIGFLPEPEPGQTIEDIARAEAIFLEKVIARHPKAEGNPCVVGNCQAGWAITILASLRPELFGPIILAGTPLAYWAGVHGQNPMRYSGGLLGGSWLTALASDLGQGKFDGAWLVQNFENQNPANTLWTKQYNLYANIDTEASRYLGFERWWGGHISLNAEEIQFIVDELFVGNKLAAGKIQTSDGTAIDLRNIRSPIVVFCSKGDNITPPQQALGWILDLYESVDDIRAYGQTIVYTIHESVGHLGIFVSGGVARKEHDEFASNIDFIDVLPPGLYEAVFEARTEESSNPDLIGGNWVMRCEERTLADIRGLGGNDAEDNRRFATAARVSEANLALYRTVMQPALRAFWSAPLTTWLRDLHPLRLQYELFSDANPFMKFVQTTAERVREDRKPASGDNPFTAFQEKVSEQLVTGLDAWRTMTERFSEQMFMSIYGSPLVQAAVGIDQSDESASEKASKSPLHRELQQTRVEQIRARIPVGGMRECLTRALIYVGMSRGSVDERGFAAIRRLRSADENSEGLTLSEFKALIREQYFMLIIDEAAALNAIPDLLPSDAKSRRKGYSVLRDVLSARGDIQGEAKERLDRVAELFGVDGSGIAPSAGSDKTTLAKAS